MSIYTTSGNLFRVMNKNSLFYLSIGAIVIPDTYGRNLSIIFDPNMLQFYTHSTDCRIYVEASLSYYQFIGTGDIIEHLNKL